MKIRGKLLLAFSLFSISLLVLLTLILQIEVSRHFGLLVCQPVNSLSPVMSQSIQFHFDQALKQSLIWTLTSFVAITMLIAAVLSKLFTQRIMQMQELATQIAHGQWQLTVPAHGRDELSLLAKTMNYLAEQLNHQEKLRKHLTQDIAHELRTPLTTLKSHIEAFLDGVWEPSRERLHSCLEEVERFESLVSGVETLYRADMLAAKAATTIEVNDMTASLTHFFEPRCVAAELTLQVITAGHPLWIDANPDDVYQILWNLLDNAVKYTPAGGTIEVRTGENSRGPFVRIQDTGIGIPKAELDNIFERFYRVDKSRNRRTGGSGLGLAIVKRLASLSGATVEVESQVSKGSTFTVYWPRKESPAVP